MLGVLSLVLLLLSPLAAGHARGAEIVKADPSSYRVTRGAHAGAGELLFSGLVGAKVFNTNLTFVHRGVLQPKGGIGHHFHSHMEEMFIILDNEAEFTINGRTSRIAGPAVVPCRMGSSHAVYNPTDRPTEWMNIAVGTRKGEYDSFDLGDDRVGAPLDETPVFISGRLDRSLLRPAENQHGGKGTVQYRRVLGPAVFYTNWSYVDHLVLPPGTSVGKKKHAGVEEFYYVMSGSGVAQLGEQQTAIEKDHGLSILLNDVHGFENNGNSDLEFMIIGVAKEKWELDTVAVE